MAGGIKIKVDTSDARSETKGLAEELKKLGDTTKLTAAEIAKLQAAIASAAASGQGSASMDRLAASIAKTKTEADNLNKSLGNNAGLFKTLKDHWVAASAAALGLYYSLSKTKDAIATLAMAGARYETLGIVMEVVGKNLGYTSSEMHKFSEAIRDSGISMTESRQSLTRMAQAQLDLTKAAELARVAQDAAVIGDINSTEAFERMVRGIQSGQTEILKTIGINIQFEDGYKKLAKTLGKNAEQLSASEKALARQYQVMDYGTRIAGVYTAAMETAGKQITSFPRYLDDFKVKMGLAFNPATAAVVKEVTAVMKDFQTQISKPEAQKALKEMADEFARLIISVGKDLPAALDKLITSVKNIITLYNTLPSGTTEAIGGGIIGRLIFGAGPAGVTIGAIILATNQIDRLNKALNFKSDSQFDDPIGTRLRFLEQKRKGGPQAYEVPSMSEADIKKAEASAALLRARKKVDDSNKEAADAKKAEREKKLLADRKSAEEKIPETIRKNAAEIEAIGKSQEEKELIKLKSEIDAYRKIGVSKILIDKYVVSETAKITGEAREKERQDLLKYEADKYEEITKDNEAYLKKMVEDREKGREEYEKILSEEADFAITENQRAINKIIAAEAKKLKDLEKLKTEAPGAFTPEEEKILVNKIKTNTQAALKQQAVENLKIEADYYEKMEGYEKVWFEKKMALIEAEKQARIFAVTATAAAAEVTAVQSAAAAANAVEAADAAIAAMKAAIAAGQAFDPDQVAKADKLRAEADAAQKKASEDALKAIKARGDAEVAIKDAGVKAEQEQTKAKETRFDMELQGYKNITAGLGQMLDSAMSMYDQESSEYKRLSEWKKGVQIAEIAIMVAKNAQIIASNIALMTSNAGLAVSNAGTAITGAAIGVGPLGFATAAAMIALMAGVFSAYGIAAGGGPSVAVAAPPKTTMTGMRSTVLGAEYDFESESIANALEMLDDSLGDIYQLEYRELRGIHSSMRQLNTNITGLVRTLVSGGDEFTTGGMFSPFVNYNINQSTLDQLDQVGKIFGSELPLMTFLDPVSGFASLASKLYNDMFGGSRSVTATGGGINFQPGTVGGLESGQNVAAQEYAWREIHQKGGWFSSSKNYYETMYQQANADTTRMLTLVYKNMSDTLVYLTEGLGQDLTKTLAYSFGTASFELAGLTGEEVTKKLQGYFSQVADLAVKSLFGEMLKQYQQVGEGLFETAIRVMMDKEIITQTLKMTGQAFVGTIPQIIAFSESVIKMAGGLDKFTEAASIYYDNFYSDAEKMVRSQNQMLEAFEDMDLSMPRTRDAYRELVESLNLMTDSGKEAYVSLIMMSEATDKYYDMLDDYIDKLKSARESMRMEGLEYDRRQAASSYLAFNTVLEQARLGNFSGLDKMDRSLSQMTSAASSTRLFATKAEYEANFYKTYNSIAELEGILGGTVSIEEQALAVSQNQLAVLQQIATNTGSPAVIEGGTVSAFASGGDFGGGWRVVGEQGPELEYTGPSTIYSNSKSKSMVDNTELLFCTRQLLKELKEWRDDSKAQAEAIAKNTNKSAKIFDRWDIDGLPEERVIS